MAARTLELQRDSALEMARISMVLIHQGREEPTLQRLEFIASYTRDAVNAQRKIEKREEGLTRAT